MASPLLVHCHSFFLFVTWRWDQECGGCLSTFLRSMGRKQGERVLECIPWMDLSLVTPGKDVNDSVYLSWLTFTPVKSKPTIVLSSPAPQKSQKGTEKQRNVCLHSAWLKNASSQVF